MVIIPYTDGLSSATVGMPIISATDLGIVSDWCKDNCKYNIAKVYSSR
jgi:hypothetical protein